MTQQNKNNPLSTGIPTSGYVVVEQDDQVLPETTGLIPELEALAQERLQLAVSAGAGNVYLNLIYDMNATPENWAAQKFALADALANAGQAPNATLNQVYNTDVANFMAAQYDLLGFFPSDPYALSYSFIAKPNP
jgi:hypothetical protein